jgi:predicted nucleotide-binding protein
MLTIVRGRLKISSMPMALDFLLVLDQAVRENNLGYVPDGATLKTLALESGLADRQDQWSAARWTGELVDLGYVSHTSPGLGDRRPLPKGGYADSDLYRFSDYRLTASGYDAADRERSRRAASAGGAGAAEPRIASVVATLKVSKAEAEELLDRQIQAGQELMAEAERLPNDQEYDEWKLRRSRWLSFTVVATKRVFVEDELAAVIGQHGARVYVAGQSWQRYAQHNLSDLRREVNRVRSLREQLELADEPSVVIAAGSSEVSNAPSDIFIVHGRDTGVREEVARFVHAITGMTPVILHEQANEGRTLIEKFEAHAQQSGYVIVLATGDDKGGPITEKDENLRPRPRQNVVFEMGFFFGSLGRKRVAVLHEEGIEPPSDIAGLVYIVLTGNWKLELYRELKAAGIGADISKAS